MKVYRVKHIATGLYYKPGANNLDEQGKVYRTKNTILSMLGLCYSTTLHLNMNSKVYKKYKNVLDAVPGCKIDKDWQDWDVYAKSEDFELVESEMQIQ